MRKLPVVYSTPDCTSNIRKYLKQTKAKFIKMWDDRLMLYLKADMYISNAATKHRKNLFFKLRK